MRDMSPDTAPAHLVLDEHLFRQIVDKLQDAIFLHAPDGRILYVNERMLEIHNLPDTATALAMNVPQHFSTGDDAAERMQEVVDRMWADGRHVFEWQSRRQPDGAVIETEIMLHPIRDSQGNQFFFAQARDIGERKQRERELREQIAEKERLLHELRRAQERLEALASSDPLTGLANRRRFAAEADRLVTAAMRYARPLSLILIDIDNFKRLNDSFGHLFGDEALCRLSGVLTGELRQIDLAARIGGDEFAVLLPETTAEEALAAARRCLVSFAEMPLRPTGSASTTVSASAGVATWAGPADDFEAMFRRADGALLDAKSDGRNRAWLASFPA